MERVKLKKLLKNISVQAIRGSKEVEITGLSSNSKLVTPGDLFIAKKGLTHDGARFIPDAVAAGAVAILTDLYDPFFSHIVQIIDPDVNGIEAKIAKAFYADASDHLFLVGITGTSGKTTTSYLVRHVFEGLKEACGLIGGVEWMFGEHVFPSSITTPDLLVNYKLFHEMILAGCKACAMEVSSHALEQGRVREIEFDVAVFTNLSHEHLDYHQTMQNYAHAKTQLFSSLKKPEEAVKKQFSKTSLINNDSPYAQEMIQASSAPIFTYGIENKADLSASHIHLSHQGIQCQFLYQGKSYPLISSLIGRFNVYNLLAAAGVALIRGFDLEEILPVLATFSTVCGRLERVSNTKGLHIFVDHAHKLDALSNVLHTLKEICKGRIITVFGCGGNRDTGKRPLMGSVAESLSDIPIVTSDNPRNEEPEEIIRQILVGFQDKKKAVVIVDRKEAIERAVQLAQAEDIILIAGKGHETTQIFSHQTIDFDDCLIAQAAAQR